MANRLLSQNLRKNICRYSTHTRHLNSATTASSPPISAVPSFHLEHKHHTTTFAPSSSTTTILDLHDVSRLFSSVSTCKLLRSSLNLHLTAVNSIVDVGTSVMTSKIVMQSPLVRDLVLGTVKHTFFEQFCAGEDLDEAGETIQKLWFQSGMRGMLIYGLEHADDNVSCDQNFQTFLDTVKLTQLLPPSSVSFNIVKITAICPITLLKRVSDLLRWEQRDPSLHLPWKRETLPIFADSSPLYHTLNRPDPLSAEEEHDLQLGYERFQKLCDACEEFNIPLLVDAEDTIMQPAIDYFTYSSAIRYNKDNNPLVFGTIQAYLRDARQRLHLASEAAEKMGIAMGYKLVRGAYMSSETKLADSLGFESQFIRVLRIHTLATTTALLTSLRRWLMARTPSFSLPTTLNQVLTTSGKSLCESGKLAVAKAHKLGINSANEKLQFAQLYGMSESLSFSLKNAGFNVSKYIPFGPIDRIIPYLLRRAEENRGMLSSSILDRVLMRKELRRRLTAGCL